VPEEVFVPAKPQVKSLLKSDQNISTAPRTGSGSIPVQLPALNQGQVPQPDVAPETKAVTAETTDSGNVRLVRPARPDVASRTQRVRSIPQPATPQEQKKSITKPMSGIEEIMKRQDEAVSGQDRKKENEMWMRLLKELNTEKERLEVAAEAEELSEKDAENKTEQSQQSTEGKPQDKDSPAPVEPNES
jgi:hypothetical protein